MIKQFNTQAISLPNIIKDNSIYIPNKNQDYFVKSESFKDILSESINSYKKTNSKSKAYKTQSFKGKPLDNTIKKDEFHPYKESNLEKRLKEQTIEKSKEDIDNDIKKTNIYKKEIDNKNNIIKNTNENKNNDDQIELTEEERINIDTLFENLLQKKEINSLLTKKTSAKDKNITISLKDKIQLKELIIQKTPKEISELLKKILSEKQGVNLKDINLKELSIEEFKQFSGINDPTLIKKLKQSLELLKNNKAFAQLFQNEKISDSKSELLNTLANNKNVSRETKNNKNLKNKKITFNTSSIDKETTSDNKANKILEFNLKQENLHNAQKEQNSHLTSKIDKFLDKKDTEINSTLQHLSDSSKSIKELIKHESIKQEVQKRFESLLNRSKVFIKNKENATLFTKLFPEKLGKINLKLVMTNGQIHGKFLVESEEVQKLLQDKLMRLAENMNAEGFENTAFDVSVFSEENKFANFAQANTHQDRNQNRYNINNKDFMNNEIIDNNKTINDGVYYA